ncbi:MAG: hypothetical protein ACPL1F_02860 [bacterium]
MDKENFLIKNLQDYLLNLKIKTFLLSGISFVFFLIIFAFVLTTEDIAYIIFAIFFSFIIIGVVIYYYNNQWYINSKRIIIENIHKIIKIDQNINIKYNPLSSIVKNKSISFNLLAYFLNELILANTDNLKKSMNYLQRGFERSFNFKLEDEIIIKTEDNLEIQVVEIFLIDKYTKTEGSGKNKRITIKYITNFQGVVISTNLINDSIPKTQNQIIIYSSELFLDPINIKIVKLQEIKEEKSLIFFILKDLIKSHKIDLIDLKNLKYQITNLYDNIYCLYNLNDEDNFKKIENILTKVSQKIYNEKKFYKSIIVYNNDILYLFINHEDNIFNTKNILEPYFYLFTNTTKLKKMINNFKIQFEKILELAL